MFDRPSRPRDEQTSTGGIPPGNDTAHTGDTVLVAIAGNPNVGKTTVFNQLTGLHQKVGNYPGITVERKTGSEMVGLVGHKAIFYREHADPEKRTIRIPRQK